MTINSLESSVRRSIRDIESAMIRVNKVLREDITLLKESSIEVIQKAGNEINTAIDNANKKILNATLELENSLENTAVVVTESAAYVVDEFFNKLISVVSLIFLGLGLLLFIYLFYTRRQQRGMPTIIVPIFMAVFLAGFGALLFSAPARAYVLSSTQVGIREKLEVSKEKSVVYVNLLGSSLEQVKALEIRGRHLTPNGVQPTVKFAGQVVQVIAANETEITVDVSNVDLDKIDLTNQTLVLEWKNNPPAISVNLKITPTSLPPTPTPTPNLTATAEVINAEQTREFIATQTAIAIDNPNVQFTVNSEQIDFGTCVKFGWNVQPISSVTFDGNTVSNQAELEVCPTSTKTFVLEFVKLNGNHDTRSISIIVRPAPEPPTVTPTSTPAPIPIAITEEAPQACTGRGMGLNACGECVEVSSPHDVPECR